MKKIILTIVYTIFSVGWLALSVLFISPLWLGSPGAKDWKEDSTFIPIGIMMLVIWAVGFASLIFRAVRSRKNSETDSD